MRTSDLFSITASLLLILLTKANADMVSSLSSLFTTDGPQVDASDAKFMQYQPAGPEDCQSTLI